MFFSSYVHPFTKELDDGFCYLPFIAKRRLKSILWLLTLYPRWGICSMLDEKKIGGLQNKSSFAFSWAFLASISQKNAILLKRYVRPILNAIFLEYDFSIKKRFDFRQALICILNKQLNAFSHFGNQIIFLN